MYVFVEISFDPSHLAECITQNFKLGGPEVLAMMGTIQFSGSISAVRDRLGESSRGNIIVPQVKPLSSGETLGCTSPKLPSECTSLVFVADGRFHLESAMIQNHSVRAYRYDPYSKILTREGYDVEGMKRARRCDSIYIIISSMPLLRQIMGHIVHLLSWCRT
jgi:2-(3-amino-3-carboxypropyl)histidine synthase